MLTAVEEQMTGSSARNVPDGQASRIVLWVSTAEVGAEAREIEIISEANEEECK
jgi:hypothetical protein